MSIIETMNTNILNRFESKKVGTKITKYSIKFKNGKSCTRVFMHEISENEAMQSIIDTFSINNVDEVLKL